MTGVPGERRARSRVALLAVSIALICLCNARPGSVAADATCAATTEASIRWVRVSSLNERAVLDRWCAGVGPPARMESRQATDALPSQFAVVSWNMHVGGGDVDAFVADLRSGRITGKPQPDFVLLLQEAYRSGSEVPSESAVSWAAAQLGTAPHRRRVDLAGAAQRLGLSAIYIPSMRNGRPGATTEDRGNAMLSTVRLSDVAGIELPLERQRRVAIGATVAVKDGGGAGRHVRLVCTHFTNVVMHHLWVLSESGRLRQARALGQALPTEGALILGGDLNSWFGYHDAAYRELAARMPTKPADDRRPTFGPMRLDHLLFRLPAGWRADVRRAAHKYGSDHYPLVALVDAR